MLSIVFVFFFYFTGVSFCAFKTDNCFQPSVLFFFSSLWEPRKQERVVVSLAFALLLWLQLLSGPPAVHIILYMLSLGFWPLWFGSSGVRLWNLLYLV